MFCFDCLFLRCNTSSVGILRYSLKGLQLCTKVGWRNIVLEDDPPRCSDLNVPERNFEAFLKGNPGIMFQFNGNITPLINPSDYNSTIRPGLTETLFIQHSIFIRSFTYHCSIVFSSLNSFLYFYIRISISV